MIAEGQKVPEPYLQRPEVPFEHQIYLDAFSMLSVSRPLYPAGLGHSGRIGFIPLVEIESYCRLFEVEDIEIMVRVLRHLDGIYVARQNEKLTPANPTK